MPFARRALPILFLILSALLPAQKKPSSTVPFIGCPADGQVGPLAPPKGEPKSLPIPPEAASQLAYYKAEYGIGVLAPRGWHCFGTYGSSGSSLFVFPGHIDSELFFSSTWKGFTGPAVQVSSEDGGTSGRFGVAETIARVFPTHRAFVRRVINEGIRPAKDFPYGPYPADKLTYRSKEVVEFQTPPHSEGLGTQSWLKANDTPINGVAVLLVPPADPDYDLFTLTARLPPNFTPLTSLIIQQVERDAAEPIQ